MTTRMTLPLRPAMPPLTPGRELAVLLVLAWLALVSIPLALGGIGLTWDALNHHFYLGWVSEGPRFDRDLLAASYQSYQYPYLYWPAYKLAEAGVSGRVAGTVLVTLHVAVVPALWLIARSCIPEAGWYGTAMRMGAVLLGLSGELSLSLLDTTANDSLAAIPFVWAVALALMAAGGPASPGWLPPPRAVMLSGLLVGVSVAFKFSNGPLALVLPLLWLSSAGGWRGRILQLAGGCLAVLAGFFLAYGYWGAQLWNHFGNPMYPFYDGWFAHLRALTGWQP